MLIVDEITQRVKEKRLFEVIPESQKASHVRRLYVTEAIQQQLVCPVPCPPAQKNRMQALLADLQAFASGDTQTVSLNLRKHRTAMLARLDKPEDEVWELRHRNPSPGLRLMGRFAHFNMFIATEWYLRSQKVEWSDKEPIGGGDANYRKMIRACQQEWDNLFPNHSPHKGLDASEYLSQANII